MKGEQQEQLGLGAICRKVFCFAEQRALNVSEVEFLLWRGVFFFQPLTETNELMPSEDLDLLLLSREKAPFSALKAKRSTKTGEHAVYLGFKPEKQNNLAEFERIESYHPQQAIMCVFVLNGCLKNLSKEAYRAGASEILGCSPDCLTILLQLMSEIPVICQSEVSS